MERNRSEGLAALIPSAMESKRTPTWVYEIETLTPLFYINLSEMTDAFTVRNFFAVCTCNDVRVIIIIYTREISEQIELVIVAGRYILRHNSRRNYS